MRILRNDNQLKIRVECENNRTFKKIKTMFRMLLRFSGLYVDYDEPTKTIVVECRQQETYYQILESIPVAIAHFKQQGYNMKVSIENE